MELEEATRDLASANGSDGTGSGISAGDADLLSALPDCVLHSIMSFLKAQQAVQTCVLSKRWRHLWRSMPRLDVDFNEFKTLPPFPVGLEWYSDSDLDSSGSDRDIPNSEVNERKYREWREEWEGFEDFSANLMHRFNISLLDSFRLNVSSGGEPMFCDKFAGGWLRRAMKYCAPDPSSQREGLCSNSWRLRRLYLCNVALDNRFAKHVSLVCHSLEDLELEDCTCETRAITSHSLKNLVLKKCRWLRLSEITSPTLKSLVIAGGSNSDDCVLIIVAPVIGHLCLDVPPRFARRVSVNQMPSLPR